MSILTSRPKIVVLGMMTRMPVAGVVWQTIHYLLGFHRLGYDVYYVEAHGCTPSTFIHHEGEDGSDGAAAFIDRVMRRFDFADKWAYQALHADCRCLGISESGLKEIYRDAALIINLHGGTVPRPEHYATNRLVFLETDPVELQIELHQRRAAAEEFLLPHCAFFSFGENLGQPDCNVPLSEKFRFHPTRQPVAVDFWDASLEAAGDFWTTIGNWRQSNRRIRFRGEVYHWSKHLEFAKFLDLPQRSREKFELALSGYDDRDRKLLEGKGWHIRPANPLSNDLDAYRDYLFQSKGEFTVAKDQNIRLRSGWFSDRSATYLAAGRPVITQETGFSNILPTGRGLFAFSTMDDILGALDSVLTSYADHCRAAREVAEEWFDAQIVLSDLLNALGLERRTRLHVG
jgi:hypothetical protein